MWSSRYESAGWVVLVQLAAYSAGVRSPEGGVRPVGVVLDPPGLDEDLGLEQGGELLDVEQLVADAAVEGLDEGVLPRRAGLDVGGPDAGQAAVVAQRPGDHLGAVVHPQVPGRAADGDQGRDDGDDLVGGAGRPDPHRQRLAGVLVDDVQRLQPAPVGGLVELEVDAPTPGSGGSARSRWAAPGAWSGGACVGADRAAQTLVAPQPLDALVVDAVHAWLSRRSSRYAIRHPHRGCFRAIRRSSARSLVSSSGRGRAGQPLGRAVRADDPAGPTFGDPEPSLQMRHGPAATVRGQKFPSASSLSMSMSSAWFGDQLLQPGVLGLQLLEPLGLVGLHPAVLGPPPVPGRLGDLQGAQHLGRGPCRR